MSDKYNIIPGFTQEEIDEIFREEAREKTILEELIESREHYEETLYVSNYDRALLELPIEAETEYCFYPKRRWE